MVRKKIVKAVTLTLIFLLLPLGTATCFALGDLFIRDGENPWATFFGTLVIGAVVEAVSGFRMVRESKKAEKQKQSSKHARSSKE